MNGKSLLFGLGLGLILGSVLVYFTSTVKSREIGTESISLSDDEIIEKAKALGMVMLFEEPSEKEKSPKTDAELTEYEIAELAADIGMIFPAEKIENDIDDEELPEGNNAEETLINENISDELPSDDTLPDEMASNETTAEDTLPEEHLEEVQQVYETQTTEVEPNQPDTFVDTAKKDGEIVSFRVLAGMSAHTIAKLLENNGIIEDSKAFEQFAINKNVTRTLRAGYFSIKKGIGFDELLSILRLPTK